MYKLQDPSGNGGLSNGRNIRVRSYRSFILEHNAIELGDVELVSGGSGGDGEGEAGAGEDGFGEGKG